MHEDTRLYLRVSSRINHTCLLLCQPLGISPNNEEKNHKVRSKILSVISNSPRKYFQAVPNARGKKLPNTDYFKYPAHF